MNVIVNWEAGKRGARHVSCQIYWQNARIMLEYSLLKPREVPGLTVTREFAEVWLIAP